MAEFVKSGKVKVVSVNLEDNTLMKMVQKLFVRSLRQGKTPQEQARYFFLKKVPDSVKDEIGVLNSRVGYVYLVDEECRIRWAGCGNAQQEEKESLFKGIERLLQQRGQKKNITR